MPWYLSVVALIVILTYWIIAHRIRHQLKEIEEIWAKIVTALDTRRRRIQELLDLITPVWKFNPDIIEACNLALTQAAKNQGKPPELVVWLENILAKATMTLIQMAVDDQLEVTRSVSCSSLLERIGRFDDDEIYRLNIAHDELARKFNDRFSHGLDSFILRTMRVDRRYCLSLRRVTPRNWADAA